MIVLTLREALDAVWDEHQRRSAVWSDEINTVEDPATRTRLHSEENARTDSIEQTLRRIGRLLGIPWKPGQ